MSATETFAGDSYEMAAWYRGQRALIFQRFGSYQGEWLMFARDDKSGDYLIYKGWYGSCGGCDDYEGHYFDDKDLTRGNPKVREFAEKYPPFIEIPRATAAALAVNGTLLTVFPANVKDEYSSNEVDTPAFARDAMAHIKLEERLPFTVDEVWATGNQELRRRAWESYGVDRFVADAGLIELDREGDDALVDAPARQARYLFLKDSSTPRHYLLQVPPTMARVRQAKAWSFDVAEADYQPLIET